MPLPSITEDEYNELKIRQQLEQSKGEQYVYRPPDTSAVEQQLAPPPLPSASFSAPSAGLGGAPSDVSANPSATVRSPEQLQALGQSQFGQDGVSYAEALAACGPAAALAFASATGRAPSLAEALELARNQQLWSSGGGMKGPAAEQQLLSALGVPSRVTKGVDWGEVQRDVGNGNPVMLSAPGSEGHYWQILGYRPEDGRYYVGPSGTAYTGGSEWMSPAEMAAKSGAPDTALYLDNPYTPGPSIARTNPGRDELVQYARGAAQRAGVDPGVFERQIDAESGFRPDAKNPSGASGIAQIVPQWHPGVDVSDPFASLDYAAQLMAGYVRQYGSYGTALAAYNAGPGAVAKYGGPPPFKETQDYLAKILPGGQEPGIPDPLPESQLPPAAGRITRGTPNLAALNQQTQDQLQGFSPYQAPPSSFPTYQPPPPKPLPPVLLPNQGPPFPALGNYSFGDRLADLNQLPGSTSAVPAAPPLEGPPMPALGNYSFGDRLADLNPPPPPAETIRPAEDPRLTLPFGLGNLPGEDPRSALQNAANRYPEDPVRGLVQGGIEGAVGAVGGAGPAINAGLRALLPDIYAKPEAALRYQPTPEQIAGTQIPLPLQGRETPFGRVPEGASISPLQMIPPEGLGFGAAVENVLDPVNLLPSAIAGRAVGRVGEGFERAAGIANRDALATGARLAEQGAVSTAPLAHAAGPLAERAAAQFDELAAQAQREGNPLAELEARRSADRVRQSVTATQPELPLGEAPRPEVPPSPTPLRQAPLPGFAPEPLGNYGERASANALIPPSQFGIGQAAERTAGTALRQGVVGGVEGAGGGALAARAQGGEDTPPEDYLKYGALAGLAGFALGAFPRGAGSRIGEAAQLAARGKAAATEGPTNLAEAETALARARSAYQTALEKDTAARAGPEALERQPDLVSARAAVTQAQQKLANVAQHDDVVKARAAVLAARDKYEQAQLAVKNAASPAKLTKLEQAVEAARLKIADAEQKAQAKLWSTTQDLQGKVQKAEDKVGAIAAARHA